MRDVEALIHQISVEIDGLKSVADAMLHELDGSFRPQVVPVHEAIKPGATIGHPIPGAAWESLQNSFSVSLQATADALYNLDRGTQAVAMAAHTIARTYGDADAFSHATVDEVRSVMAPSSPVESPAVA